MEQKEKNNKKPKQNQHQTTKWNLQNPPRTPFLYFVSFIQGTGPDYNTKYKSDPDSLVLTDTVLSGTVWIFFVIQLLKYTKKKKSLNDHIAWRMIQKNRSTAGPLRQKGNAVISANFHKCNVHSVPLAKWKEYHFLNIGVFLIEITPL